MKNKKVKIALFMIVLLVLGCIVIGRVGDGEIEKEKTIVKIGVLVYKENDTFIASILTDLAKVVKEAELDFGITLQLDIADASENQVMQTTQLERYISLEYDVICLNIVDRTNAATLIDMAEDANIPLILFNREPVEEDLYRNTTTYYVGSDAYESAVLQGEMILETYSENLEVIDKNGNGSIEYIMLEGEAGHQDTIIRTEYSIKTLEEGGLNMNQVVTLSANFDRNQAGVLVKQWLESHEEDVELIISNNDDMALGAVDAMESLQMDSIAIVGIDGVPEGIKAVEDGKMLGTVVSDSFVYAQNLFDLAYALGKGEEIPESLQLEKQRYIWIPWQSYVSP